MTAIEHLICWIESSRAHYDRLLKLEIDRKRASALGNALLATQAHGLAVDDYREATRSGDMFMGEHSPKTILETACALLEWELEA